MVDKKVGDRVIQVSPACISPRSCYNTGISKSPRQLNLLVWSVGTQPSMVSVEPAWLLKDMDGLFGTRYPCA